jgi:glutamate synthase domain-containing protein 2
VLQTRFLVFGLVVLATIASGIVSLALWPSLAWTLVALVPLSMLGIFDLAQRRHAILRNYPLTGHLRFLLESVRPEIRQYFIEGEKDAVPFSQAQRAMVYKRAKGVNDAQPFGTLLDVREPGYAWISHSVRPSEIADHDFRVMVGGPLCRQPYSLSVFNISGTSFGALSGNAIMALNRGAKLGGFAHNTGEGSISPYHRRYGGDLVWQIATGYFGCRSADGRFDPDKFRAVASDPQVKMIEVKLSQGAKPGHGGVLPSAKLSEEIASTRGVPFGEDCISPPRHSAFSTPLELMGFIEKLRQLSGGKPIGLKLAIGHRSEVLAMIKAMLATGIAPDFIVVDGAEGGTGAAPVELSNHVGMPLFDGLNFVHNALVGAGLRDQVRIGASGKLISGFDLAQAFAFGADYALSARGFMFALGCIQARNCHTNRCPTGIATQDPRRQRAIDVPDKAERIASFHANTLRALKELLESAGLAAPHQLAPRYIHIRQHDGRALSGAARYPALEPKSLLDARPGNDLADEWAHAQASSFSLVEAIDDPFEAVRVTARRSA